MLKHNKSKEFACKEHSFGNPPMGIKLKDRKDMGSTTPQTYCVKIRLSLHYVLPRKISFKVLSPPPH